MQLSGSIFFVLDLFKTQGMCTKVAGVDPWQLYYVPDHFKTQEMCNKGVRDHFFSLQYVPDWFVAQQQIKIWYGDSEYDDDDDDDDDDLLSGTMAIKTER